MGRKRMKKELQTAEAFEKNLWEEVSVSAEFDLPLAALALIVEGGWQEEDIRRALDALRAADLVALLPASDNLLIALPNSKTADARVVEERLREAVPKTTVGVALYRRGDTAEDLLERAQQAASQGARRTSKPPEISSTDNRMDQRRCEDSRGSRGFQVQNGTNDGRRTRLSSLL